MGNSTSVHEIAVLYGQRIERLLEELGARGPAKGAGELLDQVKDRLDEDTVRAVRRFLRLRNKVVHGKPAEMPMPSPQEVEQAGRAAVAALVASPLGEHRVEIARREQGGRAYEVKVLP